MTTVLQSAVVRFYLDNGIALTGTYRQTIQAVQASGAIPPSDRSVDPAGEAAVTIRAGFTTIRTTAPSAC
jgi:hypothetical protein